MNGSPARVLIGAAVAFTVALFVFGSALVRALGYVPVLPQDTAPAPAAPADAGAPQPLDTNALLLAVENDPFQPDRQPPAQRYRLPGDVEPEPPPPPPMRPIPEFLLSGTMVVGDGGAALIQVGDDPARLLFVGASMAGFRLTRVMPQAAIMSDGERELALYVPAPAQTIVAEAEQDPRSRRRQSQQQQRQQADRERQQEMRMQQIGQLLERAQQTGTSPQMLQALERALLQNRDGMQNVQISPDGRVIFRTRTVPDTIIRR